MERFGGRRRRSTRLLTLVVALAAALMVISPALRTAPARAQEATPSAGDGGAAPSTASVVPADTIAFIAFNLNQESDQWQVAGDLLARAGFTDAIADAPLDMATQMLQQLPVSLSDSTDRGEHGRRRRGGRRAVGGGDRPGRDRHPIGREWGRLVGGASAE
jgi:hypothetical protein